MSDKSIFGYTVPVSSLKIANICKKYTMNKVVVICFVVALALGLSTAEDLDLVITPRNKSVTAVFQPLEDVREYRVEIYKQGSARLRNSSRLTEFDLIDDLYHEVKFDNLSAATEYDIIVSDMEYGRTVTASFFTDCESEFLQCAVAVENGKDVLGCVPNFKVCDGFEDCIDGSDEEIVDGKCLHVDEGESPCATEFLNALGNNKDLPDCDPRGEYSPLQCTDNVGECECVDARTGRKLLEEIGPLDSHFHARCILERRRRERTTIFIQRNNTRINDKVVPILSSPTPRNNDPTISPGLEKYQDATVLPGLEKYQDSTDPPKLGKYNDPTVLPELEKYQDATVPPELKKYNDPTVPSGLEKHNDQTLPPELKKYDE
uniref:uncharacterized protein LOC120327509 n=1 Tax=Styela clava TaxID=7725 RepID=UPI0019397FF2|nr:uncharacterized protein LOC120327509 [Styela clava]